ncbi:hypothetical protein [Rhodococcus sp. 14-2483-1-1]|uniref:restriction endonuclease subunit S n=1 Tax=Rhodococcus sp. 14-2483-1-1 TaxID=2023148 RepID=UPI001482C83C|nr:hypothetical protein [Rhodococcus sp. 14-2483-1-1]
MLRFKNVMQRVDTRVGESLDVTRLSLSSEGHLYPRAGATDRQQASQATEQRSLLVDRDQLVINPMWLTGGSIAMSDKRGAVSPDYRVFAPDQARVNPRYLHHLMRSQPYRDQYDLFVRANTTFDRRIQQNDLDQLPLWLPSVEEQTQIADFLDNAVARIDKIIADRRTQASLAPQWSAAKLQEIFDELICQHGRGRLGYLIRGLEQGWSPQAESAPAGFEDWGVMRAGCVNGGVFREDDNKRLPDELEPQKQYEIKSNDLLMSRASGSLDKIGSVAVVPLEVRSQLILCDKIYRITPLPQWRPDYLAPMLRTHFNRESIRVGVSGAEGMANNLPSGVVRSLWIPLAPLPAQATAAATALEIEERQAAYAANVGHSIELLHEYKQSLITAAVTGQLDVTTAGSGIPR